MIIPNWQVSSKVKAVTTTRKGGVSLPPFDSFNLATHVDDNENDVLENRKRLNYSLNFIHSPLWLNQQHTTNIVNWNGEKYLSPAIADAAWTTKKQLPICVMTADCQPILITNQSETFVAVIHAGWQGLLDGIVTKSILQLPDRIENLKVWIGPSISQKNFEVEKDFVKKFTAKNKENAVFFNQKSTLKFQADLVGISIQEMRDLGVKDITQSNLCTYENSDKFYSYRRQQKTGRMATLIWLDA